jgi:thioredoxin-like negative regulator of GroEL
LYSNLIDESFSEDRGYRVVNLLKNNLENNSDNPQVYVSLAVAYYKSGDSDNAIETLNILSQKIPQVKSQMETLIKKIESGEEII